MNEKGYLQGWSYKSVRDNAMTHTLMHKDLEVAEVTLDASGMITYIGKVISKNHLPVDIVHD
ncbi:MAG: hypothetical protein IKA98_01275, partial [Candidatus Methanomethylophilaceae archaeon]|nr:hypothetical protein [Candidatus Methanomethylophilaceae archaeon]